MKLNIAAVLLTVIVVAGYAVRAADKTSADLAHYKFLMELKND